MGESGVKAKKWRRYSEKKMKAKRDFLTIDQ